ncbi:MAG: hypothetical protein F6K44_13130 [Moorea sp. SIO3E2]|uniref:hypothetical protein n=1 Tax=Moorena sp. SIO4E2 TaxID=2607826 RepID=UPI0013BADFF8|nr:hypothetical protein [Moorena sp. SIO4E2]NEQ09844.1 hypothetical protein [Moorena sp. SIO4E2]NEQ14738.1 hypothetical protein [Moorena sp. SIO3E2]
MSLAKLVDSVCRIYEVQSTVSICATRTLREQPSAISVSRISYQPSALLDSKFLANNL